MIAVWKDLKGRANYRIFGCKNGLVIYPYIVLTRDAAFKSKTSI